MGLWIGWNGRDKYIFTLVGLLMFFIIQGRNIKLDKSARNIISTIVLLVCFTYIGLREESFGIRIPFTFYLPVTLLMLLNSTDKIRCIPYITRWFAYLIIPSLVVYTLFQSVGLPSLGELLVSNNVDQPHEYTHRENFLFYCYTDFYDIRCNGPFIEPGHLGMMSAFLLLVNGFNFRKWESWVIGIGLLFTLSLSGFMLAVLGFVFYQFGEGKITLKVVLSFLVFVVLVIFVAYTYNNGDNLLYKYIISRLEYDDEKTFSGNNRTFGQIDLYYASLFTDNELLLYGYDLKTINYLAATGSRGTGFVMCMVKFGIVGTVAGMLFYIVYALFSRNKRKALPLLLFVAIIYWQRTYPFWFSWIICYVFGMTILENNKKNIGK